MKNSLFSYQYLRNASIAMKRSIIRVILLTLTVAVGLPRLVNAGVISIGNAEAGDISKVDIVKTHFHQAVTAVKNNAGNLKLIAWEISEDGNIVRQGDASAGAINDVALTNGCFCLGFNQVVTAVRTADNNLKLIAWKITESGDIIRQGDAVAGTAIKVSIVKGRYIVTAVRTGEGNLKLIAWDLSSDGQFERLGDVEAGPILDVSISESWYPHVATAVRTGSGDLKVILWEITNAGNIVRLGDATGGPIAKVSITKMNNFEARLVTSVRTGDGNLKLISWKDNGGTLERLDDASAGEILDLDSIRVIGNQDLMTAVRTGDSNLKLIYWKVNSAGQIERLDDGQAGPITKVAMTATAPITTAVRTNAGNLKLTAWALVPNLSVDFEGADDFQVIPKRPVEGKVVDGLIVRDPLIEGDDVCDGCDNCVFGCCWDSFPTECNEKTTE